MTKAFDKIKEGLEDALAYSEGDTSRGTAHYMTQTQSVLAAQRAEDEALCKKLGETAEDYGFMYYDLEATDAAAARIRALSQELAEASHDRDRYQADLERLRKQVQWQLV